MSVPSKGTKNEEKAIPFTPEVLLPAPFPSPHSAYPKPAARPEPQSPSTIPTTAPKAPHKQPATNNQ
jgi:hypothetical protein